MLSKGWIIAIVIVAGGAMFVGSLFLYGVGVANKETRLRNAITAKQVDNKSQYDNMWKKISQVAQVTDGQKQALLEIFTQHAQARSGGDSKNLLMKWVQESVPNVDTSTFNKLMTVITSSRDGFTERQRELLGLKMEHDNVIDLFPGSLVCSLLGRGKIDVKIVTSSRTENAFVEGKDDDVDVFQKKNKPAEK